MDVSYGICHSLILSKARRGDSACHLECIVAVLRSCKTMLEAFWCSGTSGSIPQHQYQSQDRTTSFLQDSFSGCVMGRWETYYHMHAHGCGATSGCCIQTEYGQLRIRSGATTGPPRFQQWYWLRCQYACSSTWPVGVTQKRQSELRKARLVKRMSANPKWAFLPSSQT
jgi:hypothetical protein